MTAFKRKVLYLGGFDPRGARFYHDLLAQQVATHNAQCAAPESLILSERRRLGGNSAWSLHDASGGMACEFEFLAWDDLVRRHWITNPLSLLGHTACAYFHMLRHLDKPLHAQVPKGSRYALYASGIGFLALPVVIGLVVWALARVWLGDGLALALAGALGLGLTLAILQRQHSLWILRFIIFNDALARQKVDPALWERLDSFAAAIRQALAQDWDEVLFISHSNGTVLAMPVVARLLEQQGSLPAHFALVTLGGSIPLLAARHDARWYAQALDALGAANVPWLDLGSPTDGACAPLVPPCLGRPVPRPQGLVQLSPRWFAYCHPATYQARRRDKYLTHFDYLRRLDRPSPLDYLGLTASPRPLAASIAAFEEERDHG